MVRFPTSKKQKQQPAGTIQVCLVNTLGSHQPTTAYPFWYPFNALDDLAIAWPATGKASLFVLLALAKMLSCNLPFYQQSNERLEVNCER